MMLLHSNPAKLTTDELKRLADEEKLIVEKYCIQYVVTPIDVEKRRYNIKQIGTIIYRDPEYPLNSEECYDLFINFYVKRELIRLQFYFLVDKSNKKKNWNIINIEDKLASNNDFKRKVIANEYKSTQFELEKSFAYSKFKDGIDKNSFLRHEPYELEVYTKYVLFDEILKQKLEETYRSGKFYKLEPLDKLDFIFNLIKEKSDRGGTTLRDLVQSIDEMGYPCGFILINEIIEKIQKNELIKEESGFYKVTFEGRVFNGFARQYILDKEKTKLDLSRAKSLNFATWVAGIGGISVAVIEALKIMYPEITDKNWHFNFVLFGFIKKISPFLSTEKWSIIITLFFGIILGTLIPLIIISTKSRKEKKL